MTDQDEADILAVLETLRSIRLAAEQHVEDELGPYWRVWLCEEDARLGSIYDLADAVQDYEDLLDKISRRKLDKELSDH